MKKISLFASMALLGLFFWFNHSIAQTTVGASAPTFSLPNVDGKDVALNDYSKEDGVILVFTCNHCPFSKMYEQRILDLDKEFDSKGWPVVAISSNDPAVEPDDSPEEMAKLAKKKKYTFPYLYDASQEIAKAYGATRTPHVFLLQKDANGGFKVAYIGAIDDNAKDASAATQHYVADAINAIEKGEVPATTETKAIGCGIKWKAAQ
jgi:peroxiredoxin